MKNGQKVNPNEEKVNPNEEKVNPNEEKVNPFVNLNICTFLKVDFFIFSMNLESEYIYPCYKSFLIKILIKINACLIKCNKMDSLHNKTNRMDQT